jgi:osmotically-inducible protein OsmY
VATTGTEFLEVTPETGVGGDAAVTDEMIASRVQAKYFLDSTVKARDIDVAAANGVVTLRGQVASETERAQVLTLARTTPGVQRVEDSLTVDASLGAAPALPSRSTPSTGALSNTPGTVGTGGTPTPTGASPTAPAPAATATPNPTSTQNTLETTLKQKLAANSQLKAANLNVSARDGVVLVEGSVPTAAAKQQALSAVRGTHGVTQVVDRITVAARR